MDRTNLSIGVFPWAGAVAGPIPDEANDLNLPGRSLLAPLRLA